MKENKRNIIKLVVVLLFMIIAITIVLKVGLGDQSERKHQPTTSEIDYIVTTTEDNSYDEDSINEHLIVPKTIEGEWIEGEIEIPRTLGVGEDGTINIVEPLAITSEFDMENADERAECKEEIMLSEGVEIIDSYGNEDGSITLIFDKENLEFNINYLENRFNDTLLELKSKVSINEDFNHLIIYINEDTDPIQYGVDIVKMGWCMISAQIYTGTPYDKWSIQMTTVYDETEEVMLEYLFDGEEDKEFYYDDEIWLEMFQNLDKYSTESETQQGEMER